jgi:hypothetical protein
MPAKGKLFLCYNDVPNFFIDNSGEYQVLSPVDVNVDFGLT